MVWTWQYQPAGTAVEESGSFSSQSDAESWLGEAWRELAAAGVVAVALLRDGEQVYAMALAEEAPAE